ncbi:MAG TPA: hypothetical protein VJY65_13085 [Chloroflexota bacterium]|nr:hypothetical protein [Chloroflexota bacterium]
MRLAEVAFQRAADFANIQDRPAAFVETFNTTPHWAHRERDDGLRWPVEVRKWARGEEVPREILQRTTTSLHRLACLKAR